MKTNTIELFPTKILKESQIDLVNEICDLSENFTKFPSVIFEENPHLEKSLKQVVNRYIKNNDLKPTQKLQLKFVPYSSDHELSPFTVLAGVLVIDTNDIYPNYSITLSKPNTSRLFEYSNNTYTDKLVKGDVLIFNKELEFKIDTPTAPIILIEVSPK